MIILLSNDTILYLNVLSNWNMNHLFFAHSELRNIQHGQTVNLNFKQKAIYIKIITSAK